MGEDPEALLRKLVDLVLELCRADSAGISILEPGAGVFRWPAIAGAWARHAGGGIRIDASPCGIVIDRDAPQLFTRPERHFGSALAEPPTAEALTVPFRVGGRPAGTVWAVVHAPGPAFDAEDVRLLTSLSHFAAAAHQSEERVRSRTRELDAANESLRASEQLNALLVRFSDAARGLSDPALVVKAACGLLTEQLGSELTVWAGIDWESREYVAEWAFSSDGTSFEPSRWPLDPSEPFAAEHLAGRPVIYDDAEADPRIPDPARAAMAERGNRSGIAVPVVVDRTLRAVLNTSQRSPRRWRPEEVAFVESLSGRAWAEAERAKSEAALRESDVRFRSIANLVPDLLWSSRPDGYTEWYNQRWSEYTGQAPDQAVGWGWADAIHPEDREGAARRYAESVESGMLLVQEYRIRRHDGEYRWFLVRAEPVRDRSGRLTMYGSATDIHAQRTLMETLRESEELRRIAVSGGRMGTWRWDHPEGLVRGDAAFMLLWGFPPADAVLPLARFTDRMSPEGVAEMGALISKAAAGEEFDGQLEVVAGPAAGRWIRWRGRAEAEAPGILNGVGFDVTDARRAELERRASEERQAFLLGLSDALRAEPDAHAVADRAIRMLSDHMRLDRCDIAAFRPADDRADLTPQVGNDRVPPLPDWIRLADFPDALRAASDRTLVIDDVAVAEGLSDTDRRDIGALGLRALVAPGLRKGGNDLHWTIVAASARPRRWTDGERVLLEEAVERTWAAVERARSEAALREREADLARVQRIGRVGGFNIDVAGGLRSWRSPEYLRLHGLPEVVVEESHEDWLARVHPDDRGDADRTLLSALHSEASVYENEYRIRRVLDGEVRWIHARADIERAADGTPLRLVGAHVDVTEQKLLQDALRRGEERLRLALAAARMGTWRWDVDTDRHERDANLNRLLGRPAEPSSGPLADFLECLHPEDRGRVAEAFWASVRRGQNLALEFRVVRPDGTVRWLRDQGDAFGGPEGRYLAGACMDVTDLKEAEAELQAGEEEFRTVAELVPDLLWRLDLESRTGWVNRRWVEYTGLENDVVHPWGWLQAVHPDDRENSRAEFERGLAAGVPFRFEHRLRRAADGQYRWFLVGAVPLRDADGRIASWFGAVTDVHDQQVARAELEARVAERTAELAGALTSLEVEMDRRRDLTRRLATAQEDERHRISRELHDTIGQLMAGLSLAFKAVETSGQLPPPTLARLAEAQRISDELGREVHDLAIRLRPTSLDDLGLAPALEQLVAEWSARSGVRADFLASGLGEGRLPPEVETAIYRVVQEALTNVAKHADATMVGVVVSSPGGRVVAFIEDDGVGFHPESAPPGRLGLVGMKERATLVGGTLDVESSPGSGTSVYARIPIPKSGRGGS